MKLNKKYSYCLILLFLVISTANSTAKATDETEEWKVKVGDSRTYTISKYIDLKDIDGNGDPESKIYAVTKEDGTKENVTLKKGTKYTINITALNHTTNILLREISTQIIFGNITSYIRGNILLFIQKTIDNKSYWEMEAFFLNRLDPFNKTNYSVEGNNYVKTNVSTLNGDKYESITKRNWKNGWLTYYHTIREEEFTSDSSNIGITSIEITTIFVGLTIIAITVSRKRR